MRCGLTILEGEQPPRPLRPRGSGNPREGLRHPAVCAHERIHGRAAGLEERSHSLLRLAIRVAGSDPEAANDALRAWAKRTGAATDRRCSIPRVPVMIGRPEIFTRFPTITRNAGRSIDRGFEVRPRCVHNSVPTTVDDYMVISAPFVGVAPFRAGDQWRRLR